MDKNLPARPVEVRCMIQGIQSRCSGTTQRDGIGRKVRDRADTCALVADSCKCMAKTTTISSVRSLSRVRLFATPRTVACKASLDLANSRSLLKLMPIKLVMPSNYFILCCLLLLPPSILPSIRVFSKGSVLCIRWPKYWSFSFSIISSNECSGLISFRMDLLALAVQGTLHDIVISLQL